VAKIVVLITEIIKISKDTSIVCASESIAILVDNIMNVKVSKTTIEKQTTMLQENVHPMSEEEEEDETAMQVVGETGHFADSPVLPPAKSKVPYSGDPTFGYSEAHNLFTMTKKAPEKYIHITNKDKNKTNNRHINASQFIEETKDSQEYPEQTYDSHTSHIKNVDTGVGGGSRGRGRGQANQNSSRRKNRGTLSKQSNFK
jgi:hypothetical protein